MIFVSLNKSKGSTTKLNIKNNVPYISFNVLDDINWLQNGFSTRLGGVSKGCFTSMNLGFGRGDSDDNVVRNFEIITEAMGVSAKRVVRSQQTHTKNIRVVTEKDCGKGIYFPQDYSDIDGIITNVPKVVLSTSYADCVPLYIVDTKNRAIGLAHSGWRGTVDKIGEATIEMMTNTFGTEPSDIIACIGPSICQNCYEISEDVANEFKTVFKNNICDILEKKENGKYNLDLWKCNQLIFREAGVLPNNIYVTDICTCCNPDVLFTHRGHEGKRGNLSAFLSIR